MPLHPRGKFNHVRKELKEYVHKDRSSAVNKTPANQSSFISESHWDPSAWQYTNVDALGKGKGISKGSEKGAKGNRPIIPNTPCSRCLA